MDAGRGQFLAGASLSDEQDGALHLRYAGELLLKIEKNVGFAQGFHRRFPVDAVVRIRRVMDRRIFTRHWFYSPLHGYRILKTADDFL